jgi:hypothetical protein
MVRCVNYCVTTKKPGHQTNGNTLICLENPKEAYNLECLVSTVKHGGGSVMVWAAISCYSVGPIITLHGRITAWEYVGRSDNKVHPMIQTFLNSSSWNCSVIV